MDKLLILIEDGKSDLILSEKELFKKLNELMKFELVEICDEKIILTEKGKEAKILGIEKVLKRERAKQLQNENKNKNKTEGREINLSLILKQKGYFFILLLIFLLILFFIFL